MKNQMNRLFMLIVFTAIALVCCTAACDAQDNTLYMMPDIPQVNQLNPARMKLCRIYVELPVISSVRLNIRNTGFGFHDVFIRDPVNRYLIDVASLEKTLKRINYFQVETDVDLLGFGFGKNDWYFTFGISNHSDILTYYPHDLMNIRDDYLSVIHNNAAPVNLVKQGMEATLWNSIGVSAATEIKDGLFIGFRAKYLQGMANTVVRSSDLSILPATSPQALSVLLSSRLNASFPVTYRLSPAGQVQNLSFANSLNNITGDFIFNRNRGVSFDAGFIWNSDELTEISASITDLGFISWKSNTNIFSAKGNFVFTDTDLARIQTSVNSIDLIKDLRDSVSGSLTATRGSYMTLTPIKIFGGVTRLVSKGLRAGIMTRIEIYDLRVMPSLTLSLNYTPLPWFAGSLSYTIMNNKLNQVGAGFAFGNKIAQFYLMTDNIVTRFVKDSESSLFWPYNGRMLSLRFGVNLLFGCNEKENKFHHGSSRKDDCPAYW